MAAVFRGVGEPLTIEEFPVPVLVGKEALVRVRCATICGSDLHTYFGRRPGPVPSVLGHEMVGEIADVGPAGVTDYRGRPLGLGDRVTWSMVWSCGECFYCLRGLRPKCERLMKFGHEKIEPGRELLGGMAEYCYLPEGTAIFRVPANVPDLVASPANCASATVAAVLRNAGEIKDEVVLIHGAGMLGLTACAMAGEAGAARVIAIEPDAHRRELALKFGASEAFDPAVIKMGQLGRGADVALEFAGVPESVELGVTLLRCGGRFVLAGSTFPSRPVQVFAEQIVKRMIRIIGVYNYAPEDLESALGFLSGAVERYDFCGLVGACYGLSEANAAMEFAEKERPPRVALAPDGV